MLALSLACVCAFPPGCGPVRTQPGPPGDGLPVIIVLLLDTLRADHTSLVQHRQGRSTTPFLDQLALSSFVFTRAYANATWTRPSVATLFSSRLPSSHGCEDRDGVLAPDVVTLAEVLQDNGWRTQAVVSNGQVLPLYGMDQGFDQFLHLSELPRNDYVNARKITEPVLSAVDRARHDPLFLYVHYVDPHDPFQQHPELDFDKDYTGPMDGSRESLDPWRWRSPPDPKDRQRVLDLYDGEILWLDGQLQRLVAKLEQRGLLQRAWLVVTSDHGEGMWDHRIQSHGQEVFEEQVRVPLLMRPPGGLSRRRDVHEPFGLLDLAPTLLALVDLPAPAAFEGHSWADALRSGEPAPTRPIIIDEKLEDVHLAAIVDGEHKLILDFAVPEDGALPIRRAKLRSSLLFNLVQDPGEDPLRAQDIAVSRSEPGLRLQRLLVESLAAAEDARALLGPVAPLVESDEQRAVLRALGYTGAGDEPDPDR